MSFREENVLINDIRQIAGLSIGHIMDRRQFFITSATVAAGGMPTNSVKAENAKEPKEFSAVLVDTTRCIGCRSCEVA